VGVVKRRLAASGSAASLCTTERCFWIAARRRWTDDTGHWRASSSRRSVGGSTNSLPMNLDPCGKRPVRCQNYPSPAVRGARNSTNGESLPLRGIGPGRRMATCSNGHPTRDNEMRCRKCAASLVGPNPRQLASNPTTGAGQAAPYSLPGAGSTRRSPPRAVGLLLAVIAAAICVAVTLATSDSRVPVPGYSSSARLGPLSARPNQSSANDQAANNATRSHRAARIFKDSWDIPMHDAIRRIQLWRLAELRSRW
jgi:hypothetical protein